MCNTLYLGLDAHTRNCVLATLNSSGRVVSTREFPPAETALIRYVTELPASSKHLMLEEFSLAGWIASALRPYVTELIACDPRHNVLISHGNKNDHRDAVDLNRLLRLGEFVEVFHSDQACRPDFKIAVQLYLRVRTNHARLKAQIKAKHHQAGVVDVRGAEVFTRTHRGSHLDRLPTKARREIIAYMYDRLDATGEMQKRPMLPSSHLEYAPQLSANPSGEIAWGMSSWLTLQASALRFPRSAALRVHALPLPTTNMDAEVDLLKHNARGNFRWWRPWAGLGGVVQV